jgi:hypothetical protein
MMLASQLGPLSGYRMEQKAIYVTALQKRPVARFDEKK